MLVQNKTAIVTGGGKGLGKAIALALGREGAHVAVLGRTLETIQETSEEIRAFGQNSLAIMADVSKSGQVDSAVSAVVDAWGCVDILVNNAAVTPKVLNVPDPSQHNPFLELTDDEWSREIDINLSGVFFCMRAVMKPMIEQRSGRIINIGSLGGVMGGYFSSPSYTAAKAGLIGMTKLATRWVGKYGINVNVVNPGPIQTEGTHFGQAQVDALARTIPFRRGGIESEIQGRPEDIANAVLFLASDMSSYIAGTCINVFGGQWM